VKPETFPASPKRSICIPDVADHSRRIAIGKRIWRYILGDDAAGPDEAVLAYRYHGHQRHVHPYLNAFLDMRAAHALPGLLASGVEVVRDRDARSHEGVVLNHRELSDVAVAVDLDVIADLAAVVYHGVVPDREVVPDLVLLADHDVVARL